MVKYKLNGILYDTGENKYQNVEPNYFHKEQVESVEEYYSKIEPKIVDDEFDENGKPQVKIVFIDAMDWSMNAGLAITNYLIQFERALTSFYGRLGNTPRLVSVIHDKDYWPGTESDEVALKNRELTEASGIWRPFPGKHRKIRLHFCDPLYKRTCDLGVYSRTEYNRYFNPDFPSSKSLREYYPVSEGCYGPNV